METAKITSRSNEKLRLARRVRDGKVPEMIFIEGARLCSEAISSGIKLEIAFATDRFLDSGRFESIGGDRIIVHSVSEDLLDSIADTDNPQGIVVLAERPVNVYRKTERRPGENCDSLFLYRVSNPSNLGAVVRTAEAAGIRQILISNDSADPFDPKALRASMGSAFRVPISTGLDIAETISESKRSGVEIVAVDAKGKSIYSQSPKKKESVFIFGSEAHGLPSEVLELSDLIASIPMNAPVESLNLAVACGIVLYEVRRQRQQIK